MRNDSDFFRTSANPGSLTHRQKASIKVRVKGTGKTTFVEMHTFWHIFRRFDRMWTFYILALQMAYELHGPLAGNVSVVTGENIKPAYSGDEESFLRKIITPHYSIVEEEAKKNRNGTTPHSTWCNYDGLNEYFWSIDCFHLGWPVRDYSDFFSTSANPGSKNLSINN